MLHRYGHFSEDGTEFVVTDPATPRAFDNFLWNETVFSNVQQTGVGCLDYQIGSCEAVQLLTGIGRVCDFDVFGRDGLMSRLVYIRDNHTGEHWCVNWEPACRAYDHFRCTHGLGYTIIRNETLGIAAEFRLFVPVGSDACELWTLTLASTSGAPRSLSVFVYNQFQLKYKWGFESYGDMIFREAHYSPELNAVVATKHPHKKPHNYLTAFITADRKADGWDGTRNAFVGLYATLSAPRAVVDGRCTNTRGSSDATIGALAFDIELEPGEPAKLELILGATDEEANVAAFRAKYLGQIDRNFSLLRQQNQRLAHVNRARTGDVYLDSMLNAWIKQETLFGATWCRWGWMGYRDLVQHGYGVSSFDAARTRRILLEAFAHQYRNGMALRGWNPADEKPYSDSALWLVFTLVAYLKESGEFSFLDEVAPFFDGGAATVREHVDRALGFLEANKGVHGLVLIKFGDWNDSLTAVGQKGRGESVWLSQAYAEALEQMAELAAFLGEADEQRSYLERASAMKAAVNEHAWDGRWYVRCFDDDGRPVGSHVNEQGKIYTNAQSWALITGIADEERTKRLLESLDELCLTDHGYRLLAPTFFERDESVGRISCLEPGVCENGTVYTHVNAWAILGLLRAKLPDRAFDLFRRVSPGYTSGASDPKHDCPPFVYANCYYGPDHRNSPLQMEFTWITGSVAWLYNVLLQDMLGAKAGFAGLKIAPCLPQSMRRVEVTRQYRGATYAITIENPDAVVSGRVDLIVDGRSIEGDTLPVFPKGSFHEVLARVSP
jgi:cellobiose phosphorylase